jgi:hypothetical protein
MGLAVGSTFLFCGQEVAAFSLQIILPLHYFAIKINLNDPARQANNISQRTSAFSAISAVY